MQVGSDFVKVVKLLNFNYCTCIGLELGRSHPGVAIQHF